MLRFVQNFGRARARGGTGLPASAVKDKKPASVLKPQAPPPPPPKPQAPPVLIKPLATKMSPYLDLTTTGTRTAIPPPRAFVDGLNQILKGRDIASISAHFRDMEASLDKRDQSMVKEVLRKTAPAHGGAYGSSPPLLYGPTETLAFVLHRAVPLYAVETAVLREVAASLPNFKPKSALDFGSGEMCVFFTTKCHIVYMAGICVVLQVPERACSHPSPFSHR